MNKSRQSGTVLGIMLPLGLTCLFAFCSLALALMGGRAYKNIQNSINDSHGSTVAASYLRTKILQNNSAGAIKIRQENKHNLLVIESDTKTAKYEIRIFVKDGELKESFVKADTPFDASLGSVITLVQECDFSISDDGLFEAKITSPEGAHTRAAFALLPLQKTKQGGANE